MVSSDLEQFGPFVCGQFGPLSMVNSDLTIGQFGP